MKRSEVIAIIEENGPMGIVDGYSEKILAALEHAGMTAPAIKEPCESFVLHNGQYVKVADSFVFTHKWEEE